MIVEDDDWLDDDSDDADSCEASPMRLPASDDMAFDAQPMVAKRKIAALSLDTGTQFDLIEPRPPSSDRAEVSRSTMRRAQARVQPNRPDSPKVMP